MTTEAEKGLGEQVLESGCKSAITLARRLSHLAVVALRKVMDRLVAGLRHRLLRYRCRSRTPPLYNKCRSCVKVCSEIVSYRWIQCSAFVESLPAYALCFSSPLSMYHRLPSSASLLLCRPQTYLEPMQRRCSPRGGEFHHW